MTKISIFSLFLFVGCATLLQKQTLTYQDLQLDISKKGEANQDAPLSSTQIREDIELLIYAIKRAYGGASTHPKYLLKNIDSDLRKITSAENSDALCKSIAQTVFRIPDGHLNVALDGKPCARRERIIKNVGPNLNKTKNNWFASTRKIKNKNVLVIAISGFSPGVWPGFEKIVRKNLENADALILDLRGNGGGDDASGKLLADIVAGQDVNSPSGESYQRQSPESLVIWQNYLHIIKGMIQTSNPKDKAAISSIEEYLAKANLDLLAATSGKLDEYKVDTPKNLSAKLQEKMKFQGKIYILQDKKCVSSCESTIDFFEYFPNVIKVGDNTGGMILFGNVGIFRLKNSGVMVQMPTKANSYKDKRATELLGIAPNISLENGKDAYKAVLDML